MKNCKYLLFLAIDLLFAGVIGGIMLGKPTKLTRGYESDGYACGVDPGLEEYPYVYFVNPTEEYKYRLVCVRECPTAQTQLLDCAPNTEVPDCKQKFSISDPHQILFYYESFPYKGNVCMPTSLEYYKGIQDQATPKASKTLIHDLYHSRYLILAIFAPVLIICVYLLQELKKNTTYLVWTFAITSLLMVGFLGAYFISQWNFARHYAQNEATINNFKVSDSYIYTMTNKPQELTSEILGLIFIVAFIYGLIWLYRNADRVQDLADIFEYVEQFMRQFGYLQDFSYFFISLFIFVFIVVFVGAILFTSNFTLNQDPTLGPFEKTDQSFAFQLFSVSIIFIGVWIISVINGAYQYSIFAAFNNWQHQNLPNPLVENINTSIIQLRTQISNLNLDIICSISAWLQLSPIKFIFDYIKDTLSSIFRCSYNPFRSLAVYEEVLYYEVKDNSVGIEEAKDSIRQTLKIEQDGQEVNAFEIVRNINDFFLLIVKLFIFLLSGALFLILYQNITMIANSVPITRDYLELNIYQPLFPAFVSGIIGYYIAQIYFCQYTTVQCFGYRYLSLRSRMLEALDQFRRNNGGQFRGGEADLIRRFNEQDPNAIAFKQYITTYPELEEMMRRCLIQEQDQQQ